MLNAKEAREIMIDVNQGRAKTQLDQIEKMINKAIGNGECTCYAGTIVQTVREYLESLGYNVSSYNDRNETCTTISW